MKLLFNIQSFLSDHLHFTLTVLMGRKKKIIIINGNKRVRALLVVNCSGKVIF